jgi:hypothetical protein
VNNNLEEKLKELKIGYLKKLGIVLSELKTLLADDKIVIEDLYSKIHTISGTSGMYGISELSNASTEFEFYLKPLKENPDSANINELRSKFSDYIDFLEKTISGEE